MKGKLFYDHLIIIEEIEKVPGADKEVLALADRILQQEILDVIFTYLPREKHAEFLGKFHRAPYDVRLLEYLQDNMTINIELAILDRANKTKRKILKEVKKHVTSSRV
jgi:hypothetical protein